MVQRPADCPEHLPFVDPTDGQPSRQLAELEAVYRGAPVGLAFLDAEHRYVRINARMAAMNGLAIEAHFGRTPTEVMPSLGPAIESLLAQVLDTMEPIRGLEFRAEAPGEPGRVRDWVINYDPVVDAAGVVVGVSAAVAEITAVKEVEATRRAALAAANQAKEEFLGIVSHELRTPLNAIQGYLRLLEMGIHGPLADDQLRVLTHIDRAQRHLQHIVDGLLELARMKAGRASYNIAPVKLADAIEALDSLIAPQLNEKQLTLSVDVPADSIVLADREKLVQVLLNLVSNAVKFTAPGGAIIMSCGAATEASGDRPAMCLRVQDTGIGIATNDIERIFEPFVRIERRAPGAGLGLAISRDLVRGMGGDLRVQSTPGVGSTFIVTVPRPLQDANQVPFTRAPIDVV